MKERNGIPVIGFGTSGLGGKAEVAIATALEVGFRHLDTAQSYGTEEVIGRVLRASRLKRDDVFLTTKIADANLGKNRFMPSLRQSLDRLGADHVDLLLIHWPSHRDAVPLADYLAALAEARADGLARLIGVSNFPTALLDRSVAILGPGRLPPTRSRCIRISITEPFATGAMPTASASPPTCRSASAGYWAIQPSRRSRCGWAQAQRGWRSPG